MRDDAGTAGEGGTLPMGQESAGPGASAGSSAATGTTAGGSNGSSPSGGAGGATMVPIIPGATVPGGPDSDWQYHEVTGARCRDGSAAGYYLRRGSGEDLLIFLNGGGVCYDEFFCNLNPANVNESMPGETLIGATLAELTSALLPQRQSPPNEGILARDPRNPVANFSMVFVPYCTGDVYAGTTPNSPVVTSPAMPPQQFVGYTNLGLFYKDLDPALTHPKRIVLAGSSAGSIGTLLNYQRTAEFFAMSRVFALADSGFAFRDEYLEPCLQKIWRELWGIDKILPPDCKGCFNPDGGGLAEGLGHYLFEEKFKDGVLGGVVSSDQDQVMKLFFSSGLNNCSSNSGTEAVAATIGLGNYPTRRYPSGIADFITNVSGRKRIASYVIASDLHQHIFRRRFYEDNGVGTSIASWFGSLLEGDPQHLGKLP